MALDRARGTVLVVTLIVVLAAVTGVALAAEPTISVSVDDDDVAEGETVRTDSDPDIEIAVDADAAIELVEVRVDGEIRESYEPGTESFSETVSLDLDTGENDLRVVANADETATFDATILKDNASPFIEYTSPFETPGRRAPPDSIGVSDAEVTLSGDLIDDTGVESIAIEREFDYRFAGSSDTSREFYEMEDPGDSFSQEVFLGDGENEFTVTYTDEMGNKRVHEFTLDVSDTSEPTVDVSVPSRTGAPQVRIQGTVGDNVKLDTVEVGILGGSSTQVLTQSSPEPDRDRLSVEINEEISLNEGENRIEIEATDNAGNTVEREVEVVYDPNVEPRIVVDAERTGFEDGSLLVRGRIDRGKINDVTVESVDVGDDEIVDITNVDIGGETTNRVDIDESLAVANGETQIRIIVSDAEGNQHEESFRVDPETESDEPDESGDDTPESSSENADEGGDQQSDADAGDGDESDSDGDGAGSDSASDGGFGPSAVGPGFTPVVALLAVLLIGIRLATRR
ncbi:MAG: hypothetical protein V5A39_13825 [Haloarculaceae archaeon]